MIRPSLRTLPGALLLSVLAAWTAPASTSAPDPAMAGARRLRAFVAAFNSGDAGRMLAFYRENMTAEFQARRSDEESRALYRRLQGLIQRFDGVRVEKRGEAEIALMAQTAGGDEAELRFHVDPHPPHLFTGYDVEIRPAGAGSGLPALEMPQGVTAEELARRTGAWLESLAGDEAFSGAVLVARNGKPVLQAGYGPANRETGERITAATGFDLGSITKMITQVAVGQLLREGKVGLDDAVLKHLPGYPDPDQLRKITIAHLLDHSSGLGDIFTGEWPALRKGMIHPRDFFPLIAGKPLQFEPGTGNAYSNAGYVLLGAVVESASGMDYQTYVQERIFKPAGMTSSGFLPRDGSVPGVAIPYTRRGPAGEEHDDGAGHHHRNGAAAGGPPRSSAGDLPVKGCPAGSSVSTAGDLLRFYLALESGKLLGPRWTPWIFDGAPPSGPGPSSPGSQPEGDRSIGIAGGAPGVSTVLESGDGWVIIVLANMDPPVAGEVARKIQKATRSVEG